jgi:PAS domain S-box-containing protein
MPWLERIVLEEPRIRPECPVAYLIATGLVVTAALPRLVLEEYLVGAPFLTFFPAIILAAYIGGLGPGLLAVALSAIAAWIVLIPPYWTVVPPSPSDALAIGLFLIVSTAICLVVFGFRIAVGRLRQARIREEETSRELEQQVQQRTADLQASEERLRAIFETSYQYQGFMTIKGVLLDANATSLAGIKCSLEDVVGKPFWSTPWFAGTPDMPDIVRNAVNSVAEGNTVRQEIRVNLPEGGWRWFDFTMRPLFGDDRRVIAIVPEAVETTDRHRTEEVLRQSLKMEAVGKLTGGIAHDFNNLLTGIIGNLDLMKTRLIEGRTGELDRYVTAALAAADRAASLTHRLLSFSRQQPLDPKPTKLNRLVAGMEDLIRRTVGPEITVEVVGAGGLWTAFIDQNQFENALLNLCINARDAMPRGGRLTIETANMWLDDQPARQRDLPAGQYVSVSVTDTGEGMTSEVISQAFDPFFTTKPAGKGTGLGLSMVYGFTRQSGGQVRIYSELERGTTVTLYLPRHFGKEVEAAAATSSEPREMPSSWSGETVLIVDDEPSVRALIEEVLFKLGYVAVQAEDGAAALRILESGQHIDLLITDIGLPGKMNGRELADAGLEIWPHLKILYITGYAQNAVVGNGYLSPSMNILTKPFRMDDLAAKIKSIISE